MSIKNPTLPRSPAVLEKKFMQLRDEWKAQRGHEPSTAKIVALPAYQKIIGMGQAYVVGDFRRKWWPGDYHPHMSPDYWPAGVPQDETIEAFVQALASVGYEACDDGDLVPGFEKAALYAVGDEIRHAALQQDDGTWKSKLASDEDIRHSLEGLEGPLYGKVDAFLRRTRMQD